mmetsp:Transcript_36534/g.92366  ORF Transcript_36534/g.92366 Transcript_36534/m.92366 type:complete len:720 (+) Transcript_36534:448-2607(+)
MRNRSVAAAGISLSRKRVDASDAWSSGRGPRALIAEFGAINSSATRSMRRKMGARCSLAAGARSRTSAALCTSDTPCGDAEALAPPAEALLIARASSCSCCPVMREAARRRTWRMPSATASSSAWMAAETAAGKSASAERRSSTRSEACRGRSSWSATALAPLLGVVGPSSTSHLAAGAHAHSFRAASRNSSASMSVSAPMPSCRAANCPRSRLNAAASTGPASRLLEGVPARQPGSPCAPGPSWASPATIARSPAPPVSTLVPGPYWAPGPRAARPPASVPRRPSAPSAARSCTASSSASAASLSCRLSLCSRQRPCTVAEDGKSLGRCATQLTAACMVCVAMCSSSSMSSTPAAGAATVSLCSSASGSASRSTCPQTCTHTHTHTAAAAAAAAGLSAALVASRSAATGRRGGPTWSAPSAAVIGAEQNRLGASGGTVSVEPLAAAENADMEAAQRATTPCCASLGSAPPSAGPATSTTATAQLQLDGPSVPPPAAVVSPPLRCFALLPEGEGASRRQPSAGDSPGSPSCSSARSSVSMTAYPSLASASASSRQPSGPAAASTPSACSWLEIRCGRHCSGTSPSSRLAGAVPTGTTVSGGRQPAAAAAESALRLTQGTVPRKMTGQPAAQRGTPPGCSATLSRRSSAAQAAGSASSWLPAASWLARSAAYCCMRAVGRAAAGVCSQMGSISSWPGLPIARSVWAPQRMTIATQRCSRQ